MRGKSRRCPLEACTCEHRRAVPLHVRQADARAQGRPVRRTRVHELQEGRQLERLGAVYTMTGAISITDAAYLAGFLEADGSVSVHYATGGRKVRWNVVWSNTYRRLIERIARATGQRVHGYARGQYRAIYRVIITRRGDALRILPALVPHLTRGVQRNKIELLMKYLRRREAKGARQGPASRMPLDEVERRIIDDIHSAERTRLQRDLEPKAVT